MEWKVRAFTPTEQLDNAIQELKSQAAGDLEEHFEAMGGPFSILFAIFLILERTEVPLAKGRLLG